MLPQDRTRLCTLELVAAMVIYGTLGWPVRFIALPSSVLACVRGALGALSLYLMARLLGRTLSVPRDVRSIALLVAGGACIGINWVLLFEAYRRTTLATAELAYEMMPVYVTLVSPIVLHERLTLRKLLFLGLALFGMALVSGIGQTPAEGVTLEGVLFGLGGAFFYGNCALINKFLGHVDAVTQTVVQLSVASLVLLPYVLLTVSPAEISLDTRTVVLTLLVGVVHTGLGFGLWFASMSGLPAQKIALLGYIDPIVALAVSALVFHEYLTPLGMVGAALVLGSLLASELLDVAEEQRAALLERPSA